MYNNSIITFFDTVQGARHARKDRDKTGSDAYDRRGDRARTLCHSAAVSGSGGLLRVLGRKGEGQLRPDLLPAAGNGDAARPDDHGGGVCHLRLPGRDDLKCHLGAGRGPARRDRGARRGDLGRLRRYARALYQRLGAAVHLLRRNRGGRRGPGGKGAYRPASGTLRHLYVFDEPVELFRTAGGGDGGGHPDRRRRDRGDPAVYLPQLF